MTPQEFRQAYLISQDRIGNNLQSLTNLLSEFNSLISDMVRTYEMTNTTVETFINRLEQTEMED
jgi:hypothetical protein